MLLKQGTPNKEYDDVYFEDFKDLFFFDMKLKNTHWQRFLMLNQD